MKTSSLMQSALAAFCASQLIITSLQAQEMSAEQKDVWKNVEAYWALDAAGNTAGFMEYFHADYKGWSYDSPIPGSKERATKFITHDHKTSKTLLHDIQPLQIRVNGNMAYVHYFWSTIVKDSEGKEKRRSGRWTDILVKQGNRWVLIADHGGEFPPKP